MSSENQIKLETSCILSVPLDNYDKDFIFIVNGKEIKTGRLISDLLSPKICQLHSVDPTLDTYRINTQHKGDFTHILQLTKFNSVTFPDSEIGFVCEVVEQLGNRSILARSTNQHRSVTADNVIDALKKHEHFSLFFAKNISDEIDFISAHFHEISVSQSEGMKTLSTKTIERIISNEKLQLEDEDQLLKFVNDVYQNERENCELYKYVNFSNVSVSGIREFLSIFDIFDMSHAAWESISRRLQREIIVNENESETERYIVKKMRFKKEGQNEFSGIIRYLAGQSNGDIKRQIEITSSSINDSFHSPYDAISFDDKSKYFASKDEPNQWICFDFKEHRVSPTHYTVRTYSNGSRHPRMWNVEGSEDGKEFQILDSQKDCVHLNGQSFVYTFSVLSHIKFRYIRFRQTGFNWYNNNCLRMNSFEIYGDLF